MNRNDLFYWKYHRKSIITDSAKEPPVNLWPTSWRKIHYKIYPRFKQIKLIDSKSSHNTNFFHERKSDNNFKGNKITFRNISTLLKNGAGIRDRYGRRNYPSAGARYPLEIYPIVLRCEGLDRGIYHFNVLDSTLELILDQIKLSSLKKCFSDNWTMRASIIFLITAIFDRTTVKYGERGYRHSLIEAGHLAQNLLLISTKLSLKALPYGGFYDDNINRLLDLDEGNESAIYCVLVGK